MFYKPLIFDPQTNQIGGGNSGQTWYLSEYPLKYSYNFIMFYKDSDLQWEFHNLFPATSGQIQLIGDGMVLIESAGALQMIEVTTAISPLEITVDRVYALWGRDITLNYFDGAAYQKVIQVFQQIGFSLSDVIKFGANAQIDENIYPLYSDDPMVWPDFWNYQMFGQTFYMLIDYSWVNRLVGPDRQYIAMLLDVLYRVPQSGSDTGLLTDSDFLDFYYISGNLP